MEGRSAIRGCSSKLELKARENKKKVSGIVSLPDSVALTCLAQLSRLDLAAFAMSSKGHRSLAVSPELWDLRWKMGCSELCLYVLLHIFPEPNPRWFILHPEQRRLKPIGSNLYPVPEAEASFVLSDWGIFVIGGFMNGERTSRVSFFDCFTHRWLRLPSMKIARCGASASLIDEKIYVFGGCTDCDSSNWAEVLDLSTQTWDFLNVSTPSLNIQQSVLLMRDNKEEVYAVDEDGQTMSFSPTKSIFVPKKTDSQHQQHLTHWCSFANYLLCPAKGGRILWCFPYELDWKEVKGLEILKSLCGHNDIINLCPFAPHKIAIFWIARPHHDDPYIFELWSAQIFLSQRKRGGIKWGMIHWCGALLSGSYSAVNFLYAASVYS